MRSLHSYGRQPHGEGHVRHLPICMSMAAIVGLLTVLALVSPPSAGAGPASKSPVVAVITSQLAQSASLVDAETMMVLASVPISGKPAGVAVTPDGTTAYVTAPEGPAIVRIDLASRTVTKRLTLGAGPLGVALNPKTGAVYVADWYGDVVFELSPDLERQATIAVGKSPSGLAVTPDGKVLVSADRDSNQLSIIETRTRQVVATVATGARPFGVTLSPDGRTAYTANVKDNSVSVRNLEALLAGGAEAKTAEDVAPSRDIAVGRRPYAVALAGGLGFVTDQYDATVTVFDLRTHKVVKTLDVGAYPEGIAASQDGAKVYVACWEDNTLERIDVATLRVDATVDVPDGPRAFGAFLSR